MVLPSPTTRPVRRKAPRGRLPGSGEAVSRAMQGNRHHLFQETASVTRSIADAVVLKEGDLFYLTEPGGFVPLTGRHGFGLYYHDCRYLSGFELRIAGVKPDVLVSTAADGYRAVAQLILPDLVKEDGRLLPREHLGIRREWVLADSERRLYDVITFHNYSAEPIDLPLSIGLRTEFEDVFAVRGMPAERRGQLHPPAWQDRQLTFTYDGADHVARRLDVDIWPRPNPTSENTAELDVHLLPRSERKLVVSFALAESPLNGKLAPRLLRAPNLRRVESFLKRSADEWLARETEVRSNSLALNTVLDRSLRDLRVLRSSLDEQTYFAAGVPWFSTLFGRDSLITALQTLAFDPRIAEETLRILARYQGSKEDPWRDEEPGKILHELRLGEMARTGEVPHTPYYGTVDATPLFLVLVGWHAAWTGDLALFDELRPNVEAALTWIDRYGDRDGDGYLEYQSQSSEGLVNQGWRDSADGIPNADGTLASPPIALSEVQGYVYLARRSIANLFRRAGEGARADRLEQQARDLQARFNEDFWITDGGFFALALQAGKRPAAVMTSNAGHVLWSGIADEIKAHYTVRRLMGSDMFSGWGIRTLSSREVRYNPTGYHLGTVWPHDNSLVAAGFRRYGYAEEAARLFESLVEAAMLFPDHRLPELFMGFGRADYGVPVSYPVACRPQAWAAGTLPYLLQTLLGLEPEGFDNRLRIVRPVLPAFVQHVEIHRLRVGTGRADLRFERTPSGNVAVDVLQVEGPLNVTIELGHRPFASH